jgi:hypothetical protein
MISHAALAEIASLSYRGPQSRILALGVSVDYDPRGDEIVIAGPGTKDALNWVRDLDFWPIWVPGIGPMHGGFARAALEVWADLSPKLRTTGLATYTGHSMWAAVAADLAALHAIHRPKQPFRFVGIASPRAAFVNPYFGRLLKRGVEAVNYARRNDAVPWVPTLPYHHGCKTIMIGQSTGDVISDHACARYVADLKALNL